jgi:adenylate kinase
MSEKPFNKKLMFLGPPGVGKGTYAKYVSEFFKIPTISSGDIVREQIRTNGKFKEQIEKYAKEGYLVPDEIVFEMVKETLKKLDQNKGFILDGFPRTIPQIELMKKSNCDYMNLDLVVNFTLPDKYIVKKLSGRRVCTRCGASYNVVDVNENGIEMPQILPKVEGVCDRCGNKEIIQRDDDTQEVIETRLLVYKKETEPLIQYYQKEKKILNINSNGIQKVIPFLKETLERFQKGENIFEDNIKK